MDAPCVSQQRRHAGTRCGGRPGRGRRVLAGDRSMLDVAAALQRRGFDDVATNLLQMARQRIAGDYLQPAAIFDADFKVRSAINDVNDYTGPGTGYRLEGAALAGIAGHPLRRCVTSSTPPDGNAVAQVRAAGPGQGGHPRRSGCVGLPFNAVLTKTIGVPSMRRCSSPCCTGVAREGLTARVVRVNHTSDCAAIGQIGAALSGAGIGIGLQSRGTTVIHKRGLARLNNLELFPQSPSLTLETYEQIGRNAARYAKGESPAPVGVKIDNWARLRLIVKTALLHRRETEQIHDEPPTEPGFDWEPEVEEGRGCEEYRRKGQHRGT
ncbi:MAG: propanediol/glycerol family dehydratase large subunit [Caldilineaceae bacterium]